LAYFSAVVDQVLEHDGELVVVADRAGQRGREAELERHLARRAFSCSRSSTPFSTLARSIAASDGMLVLLDARQHQEVVDQAACGRPARP